MAKNPVRDVIMLLFIMLLFITQDFWATFANLWPYFAEIWPKIGKFCPKILGYTSLTVFFPGLISYTHRKMFKLNLPSLINV